MLRLFVCTDHDTHWPVGGASVIVATDETEARALLNTALRAEHLKGDDERAGRYTLKELPLEVAQAYVLCNGDY